MDLPFTSEEFFDVFGLYNQSFWPVVVGMWVTSAIVLVAALVRPHEWTAPLVALVAALWMWSAIAYHALLFSRINPAAWLFAALFALEGVLLAWVIVRGRAGSMSSMAPLSTAGAALAAYALVYPFLTLGLVGHYPQIPTFGVPCPTTIMTIGVLLMLRDTPPLWLAVIPAAWSLVGGSASVLFRVWTDYVLLVAGILLVLDGVRRRGRLPENRSDAAN